MTYNVPQIARQFHRRLIVSCQARHGEPFRDPVSMARFAMAAVAGGAAAIRAQGPDDIRQIRSTVDVPLIGIWKQVQDDGDILITPSFDAAKELVHAGADMVALDVTRRGQKYGALDRVRRIRQELGVPVLADIATLEEALEAAEAGAAFVLSTMRGYTSDTEHVRSFDFAFLEELIQCSPVPVIGEGRIETPEQAGAAIAAGAWSVVVGSAITRPATIARRFAERIAATANGDAPK